MKILIVISLIIFIAGITAALVRYGMTRSISAIYNELEEDSKAKGWWFIAWQWGFIAPILIVSTTLSDPVNYIFFAAAILIMMSAYLGDTEEHEIIMNGHVGGAVGGIGLAAIGILFTPFWWLSLIGSVATLYMIKNPIKNHTHYIEDMWYFFVIFVIIKML